VDASVTNAPASRCEVQASIIVITPSSLDSRRSHVIFGAAKYGMRDRLAWLPRPTASTSAATAAARPASMID
jgi:hypothetical protein